MPSKSAKYPKVGDRCRKCGEVFGPDEARFWNGLHDICLGCFMRPRLIVRIAEQLQRQGKGVAS